ncbi:DUF1307 domain-containing protein [Liquorilactobacillus capillatus]|uniref:Lipoprotein n=1 Tax=Liquorilactobacillus capillatus DSM 19910 TaxID=1423731 RepID=A0A0R1LXX1_9LACO|nr:DUF1307 domain-containing protein [Liquorilactobacillus capillatus]KRL00487.1 hypothetical protein FC81_GL002016 [Liquorilactobacillus capillatus DSM 19910]
MKRYRFWGGTFLVLILTFLLAACSLLPEKQVHYQRFNNGTDTRLTYYARQDKVTRQETKNTILYSALGAVDKESAQQVLDPISKKFQGIKGLSQKITYKKTYAEEKLTIDYSKVNLDDVRHLPGMRYTSGTESNNISLKKSETLVKRHNFVKVTDNKFRNFSKKELTQAPYSIKDFNNIKLASSTIDTNATTVDELTKELGRPDRTQKTQGTSGMERGMYLWYLSPNKLAYLSVSTSGNQVLTKTLTRYGTSRKNISSAIFDSLENGTEYSAVITALGEPTRATAFRSRTTSYATLTYRNRASKKDYIFYFTNDKLISKRESNY